MPYFHTRTQRLFASFASVAFLIGVATPAALLIWTATAPTVVLRVGSAGSLASTTVDHSIFRGNTLTRVDTTTGTVMVHGVFSGLHGSPLTVAQFNQPPAWRLCVGEGRQTCAPLAGVWAGPLPPTPAARTTFDFAHYGLTTDNLAAWLVLGISFLTAVIVVGVIALSSGAPNAPDHADSAHSQVASPASRPTVHDDPWFKP